jgi:hypothetical protein
MNYYIMKKNKNKKLPIIFLSLIVVLSLSAAVYFLFWGNPAREIFLEAESRNFRIYSDQIKKAYADINEVRKPYLTSSYRSRTELTMDIKPGDQASTGSIGLYDIIKNFKLIIDNRRNPIDKAGYTQLSLLFEKIPIMDAQITIKDNMLYFTIPILTPEKYFSVDTDKLDEVYNRFNITIRPKMLSSLTDPVGVIYFNNKEFDDESAEYGAVIKNTISEKDVRYGKKIELDIAGQKVKGREIYVTPGEEKSNILLKSLSGKASSDDILMKLTYGNFSALSETLYKAGVYQLFDFLDRTGDMKLNETEKAILKTISAYSDLPGFRNALAGAMDGYTANGGISLRLVVDNMENILEQQLKVLLKNPVKNNVYDIDVKTGTNSMKYNDCRNRYLDCSITETLAKGIKTRYYIKFSPSLEPVAGGRDYKGNVEVNYGIEKDGVLQSGISSSFELDSTVDKLTAKKKGVIKYTINMQSVGTTGINSLTGEIDSNSWKNTKLNTKNNTSDLTINADLPSLGIKGYSARVNITREDKFESEPFKLSEIPQNSILNLNTATDSELNKVESDILMSFGTFYINNKPIVDASMGKK